MTSAPRCPICAEPATEHDRPGGIFPHSCIGPLRVHITKLEMALRQKEDLIMRMNEDLR
mgnify:FL=1